ncbi:MAG: hypothetical protein IIZ38_11125 [Sphingomonas sp.]|uniref:DUF7946 domain-containing protein n=1 Tax=Sphingomonas sp. TaxID=28214 RepID=UPI0025E6C90C|nr:hypothetical protein [Sphingomonas sp.]MBQ1498855.1 hypothetical protein [Sphingomonas sp.]
MSDSDLQISYKGGDADRHTVEMRSLALSLLGLERIISVGLIFMAYDRLPRRKERHQLAVKAREPEAGSAVIPIDLSALATLLPLGWWTLQTGAAEVIGHFMTYVFARLGSRQSDADKAMDALVKIREIEAGERAETQRQWLEHEAGWRDQLFTLANRLAASAIKAVAPVGPSVDQMKLNGAASPFTIDLPTADAIRAKGELEVTDLQEIDLRLDGFVHHSKKLNVENPEKLGTFISADIRDPAFDTVPNVYTEAANTKSVLRVRAKLGYRASVLEKIYVMDCGGRLDHAA